MKGTEEKTTLSLGLRGDEVLRARREHGENILSRQKRKSFLRQFLGNLNDPVIRILLAALGIHLLLLFGNGDLGETIGIGVAVFLATLISTLSEYGSARAFERLEQDAGGILCRVRRGGTVVQIPIREVVVGDIVLLSAGDAIPADGRLLLGALSADQSAMTGESREVRKYVTATNKMSPDSPVALFRGCTVTEGGGEMLVTAVGDKTFLGEISREIQTETRESPLRRRLTKLAKQISIFGYIAAALVAFAYLFNTFVISSGWHRELILIKLTNLPYLLENLLHAFTLAVSVLVTCVPEGLPMMVAVVLAANMKRMARDRVLVRKPVGIEAAGSMNILFTDKTGTLTEGKMKLSSLLLPDGNESTVAQLCRSHSRTWELTSLALHLGTDATKGVDANGKSVALGGNATARALLESVMEQPTPQGVNLLSRLPFDSTRKYAAVSLGGREKLTLIIGAPERLFPFTSEQMYTDGSLVPFSRKRIEEGIKKQTQNGKRVLALAVSCENTPAPLHENGIRGSLCYLGAFCLQDALRQEAPTAVAGLQDAGVHVVMITGDSPETAANIARACGIVNRECDVILTGEELSRLSDARIGEILPRLAVVARALPTDKSRLVRIAGERGLVVGMTGDGINDAPALRRADVGFAMGSGTQVAKDAGDIIILDNNLATIVRAVLYGRGIFKNIRKFITLQLTMNFCAVGVTMICPFLGYESPITVLQLLWINMIMDTLGGLAFAGEAALPEYMKEPPKRRDEPILNGYMLNQIGFLGAFTVGLCILFLKSPHITAVYRTAPNNIYLLTAFFALFIFSSVFNCFNARTDRLKLTAGLSKNAVFLLIMGAILTIQILFVYLGGNVLRTVPLTARELLVTMALSLVVFPADILRKAVLRLRKKRSGY